MSEPTKYAIVKDRSSQTFGNSVINPTVEIHTFKNGSYCDLRPGLDTLLKDFEIFKEEGKPLVIRGTKVVFWYYMNDLPYDKRWEITKEVHTDTSNGLKRNLKFTKEHAIELMKLQSGGKIELKPEDVKLGHFGLWNWLRNRKSYYVDTTKEIVSHFYKVDPERLTVKNGQIHRKAGWNRMLLEEPFQMETTHYRIYEN